MFWFLHSRCVNQLFPRQHLLSAWQEVLFLAGWIFLIFLPAFYTVTFCFVFLSPPSLIPLSMALLLVLLGLFPTPSCALYTLTIHSCSICLFILSYSCPLPAGIPPQAHPHAHHDFVHVFLCVWGTVWALHALGLCWTGHQQYWLCGSFRWVVTWI